MKKAKTVGIVGDHNGNGAFTMTIAGGPEPANNALIQKLKTWKLRPIRCQYDGKGLDLEKMQVEHFYVCEMPSGQERYVRVVLKK